MGLDDWLDEGEGITSLPSLPKMEGFPKCETSSFNMGTVPGKSLQFP